MTPREREVIVSIKRRKLTVSSRFNMFNFNLPTKELPITTDGIFLLTFNCDCEGELFSDILLISYECPDHNGMTTHDHSVFLEALKNEWKHLSMDQTVTIVTKWTCAP